MSVITENANKIDSTLHGLQTGLDNKPSAAEVLPSTTKYAESDVVGGVALKAVADGNGNNIASQIAVNCSTLGLQKRNLLKNTATTKTTTGITFTVNSDGTITANGTATAATFFTISSTVTALPKASLRLSGCPTGGGYSSYIIRLVDGADNVLISDSGSGGVYDNTSGNVRNVSIRINSGVTLNNLIFRPMICYADIIDNTYEPYADDVQTQINALKAAIIALGGSI